VIFADLLSIQFYQKFSTMPDTIYYGHVDKVERADELYYFEFHCFEKSFGDAILDFGQWDFRDAILKNRDQVITVTGSWRDIYNVFTYDDFLDTESTWVIIHTNKVQGEEARLFVEGDEENRIIYISQIQKFPEDDLTGKLLAKKVSLDDEEDATKDEILSLISNGNGPAEFIAAYNVGQGNSNSVCDNHSMPLLYFDLGGGCYANKHTYATCLNFCFSHSPAIVLSHWDTDHYQSAKLNTTYRSKNWIVPRQTIGPVHYKFFLSLTGTTRIWPAHTILPRLSFAWGEMVRCTGPAGKKNHTGLAFFASLNPHTNTIREVLLPADAAYTYIPGAATTNFEGLIATHHGADFDLSNHPLPPGYGVYALAYSFGLTNTYGHPKPSAKLAHNGAMWLTANSKETTGGHIAIANLPCPLALACGGTSCDLHLTQAF
jgi:hypothetical protein